jgi:hypothetical protein
MDTIFTFGVMNAIFCNSIGPYENPAKTDSFTRFLFGECRRRFSKRNQAFFPVPSSVQTSSEVASSPSLSSQIPLLSITPSDEIVFTKNSQGDLTAKVQIKNISAKPIAFKVGARNGLRLYDHQFCDPRF